MQTTSQRTYNLRDTGAVLVVWSPTDVWSQLRTSLRGLIRNANSDETQPNSPSSIIDSFLQQSLNGVTIQVRYCGSELPTIEEVIEQAALQGAKQVFVVPVVLAMERPKGPILLQDLPARIAALDARHPNTEILYLGPPFDRVRRINAILTTAHEEQQHALLEGAIERGFKGDWALFARFMEKLQKVLPLETRVALRGSAVTGENYNNGQPFDALGPGTSDLDLVLMGEQAMAEWKAEAFYFPTVNTFPLCDDTPDVAPRLNPVRVELQAMVGRPVNIQAMQKWFLDMRSELQGTPYVFLDA